MNRMSKKRKRKSTSNGNKFNAKKPGIFHDFAESVRDVIITVAIEDGGLTSAQHTEKLEIQAKARKVKEDMLKEKGMEKASEQFIGSLYYHQMYFSEACWKGDSRVMARELKKIKSDNGKYTVLKENMNMRVKGFVWDWWHHAWPYKGDK